MFERKSMEQLVQGMVTWSRGVTTNLTDFRVGSKIRSIYEAVSMEVEKLYDKAYQAIKQSNEDNLYSVMDFDKLPATNASGVATFRRLSPAGTNYFISAGTIITTKATSISAPTKFMTTEDVIMGSGMTSVNAAIVCLETGSIGNQNANMITEFIIKPSGVDTVTNLTGLSNGRDEETKEAQKIRFQKFIQSRTRGTMGSCEYGATTVKLIGVNGAITESVKQALASEDVINRKGEVNVYIWNGIGTASPALIAETNRILLGYRDTITGEPVYGYKPAGIQANIYSAVAKNVTIKLEVTPETWTTLNTLKPSIENEIDGYFTVMKLGQTAFQTAMESLIKFIDGVQDVKLYYSTDNGVTYVQSNITAQFTEVMVAKKPIIYV